MGNSQSEPVRIVTITDSYALPHNEKEMSIAFQQVVGALRGVWGMGQWDGGVGGTGYWQKHGMFWDAILKYTTTEIKVIQLPFKARDTVATIHKNGEAPVSIFLNDVTSISVDRVGDIVVQISMAKNLK
jgi:hypothetical protein